MKQDVIALIDCNNMFASCELAFRPDLKGRPVVVLSSNDACCIARSYEAKALGIQMAQPYHEVRHFERTHGLIAFSANFTLYTDMSQRIVQILEEFSPDVVPYSIDESFIKLPLCDYEEVGKQIRAEILQRTGIGTGVGISTSKTLAKLANNAAKKWPKTCGVVDLATNPARREKLLAVMPIEDIWGIGKRLAPRLHALGVRTALDLANFGYENAKRQFSITLARTVNELNGISTLPWEDDTVLQDQIIASRSFGSKITDKETVLASLVHHVSRGIKKLREQDGACSSITIYISTNLNSSVDKHYRRDVTLRTATPSNDVQVFTKLARKGLDQIWRDGFMYAKSGITLTELIPNSAVQDDLFGDPEVTEGKSDRVQDALDSINAKFGLNAVHVGSHKQGKDWQPRSNFRSPNYTTNWNDLPVVKSN